jgi:hypothetical protein
MCYACDKCREAKLAQFRPDILEREIDELIEAD